jgi:hypothetical protein
MADAVGSNPPGLDRVLAEGMLNDERAMFG